jgi:hypothetical protein
MAAGAAAALEARAGGQRPAGGTAAPLDGERKFKVGGRGAQIVARAQALGREYEGQYGNCAQCTIAALQDAIEFIPKSGDVFLAASCLHGGATKTGSANCGGFTGAGMVIGHLCGRPRDRFGDRKAAALANKLLGEVAGRYEQAYGGVLCKDVREKAAKNCPEVVARAAGWAAESILKQFSDYDGKS